jgi:hypothetical protein
LTSRKISVSGQSGTYTDRKSGSFEEFEGKSMLCHMYAIRAYSFGAIRRQ